MDNYSFSLVDPERVKYLEDKVAELEIKLEKQQADFALLLQSYDCLMKCVGCLLGIDPDSIGGTRQ